MGGEGFAVHLPNHPHCPSSLILVLGKVLWEEVPQSCRRHLISPIGLSVKTGILTFSEAPLVITGWSLQRESSWEGRLQWKEGEMILWLSKRNLHSLGHLPFIHGGSAYLSLRQIRCQRCNVASWTLHFWIHGPYLVMGAWVKKGIGRNFKLLTKFPFWVQFKIFDLREPL